MYKYLILTGIFVITVFPFNAESAAKWYYNDSLTVPTDGLPISGLIENDILLARFFPDSADFPLKILTLQVLVKSGTATPYTAKVYDGSGIHPEPGTELCSVPFTAVPDVFYNIDLTAEDLYIYSGTFVAGYQVDLPGISEPGMDLDGCSAGNNIYYSDIFSSFLEACFAFVLNDFVIRCEVETNAPTPTPEPTPTPTYTPTFTSTPSPLPIPVLETRHAKGILFVVLSCALFLGLNHLFFKS